MYISDAIPTDVLEQIQEMHRSDRKEDIHRMDHRLSEYIDQGKLRERPDISGISTTFTTKYPQAF